MRQTGSFRPIDLDDLPPVEPWEELRDLIRLRTPEVVLEFLAGLQPGETARAMDRLDEADQLRLLEIIPVDTAADVLDALPDTHAAELLETLPAERAAAIMGAMPSNERADLLGDIEEKEAEAILERMPVPRRTEALRLLSYDEETAGGVMITEYVGYREDRTVNDVIADLRANAQRYQDYDIQYAYVQGPDDRLLGVLRLRDLLLTRPETPLAEIMLRDPLRVADTTPLQELKKFFDEHMFYGVPVVDADDRLVGVVRRAGVERGLRERATQTFLAVSGLSGEEELRSMPLTARSRRRLSWLSINIALNVLAASMIALYQDTLSAVIALAVFLPIISDMSGCSGNQSVAVSIRELTLDLIRPYEFMRVVVKEGAIGILNGAVLGILLGSLAFAWKGNIWLGLVVGTALALNTLVAVMLGGMIPLVLKRFKQDPALASGPILTTVTDMCGFFLVLSLATLVLPRLLA